MMQQIDIMRLFKEKNCLIIDDMSEIRGGLSRMLDEFGIRHVDTAANSEYAMELCEKKHYDLVLCDYNLGKGQDGQQVLEELRYRKLLKNTSLFLMITAETSRDMVLGALEYLPDDYLTKPITHSSLRTRLSRIVVKHSDLIDIKQAIDEERYEKAITICQKKLDSGGKYESSYLRMQAELLFRLERYDEAQEIYQRSLEASNPVWAQLGLGKTYLATKRYDEAEEHLTNVAEADNRFVEAHDLLADLYSAQGMFRKAQQSLQNAVDVSPKSVIRQRRLGNIADINHDVEVSRKARRNALKVGEKSCYYTPQDYFDLITGLISEGEDDLETRVNNAKDAAMYMRRAQKKHPQSKPIKMQIEAAKSRVATYQKKTEDAAQHMMEANKLMESGVKEPMAQLELAQAMRASGDEKGAAKLIKRVAAANPDSSEVADRADALSDEPVSPKGRKVAAELTKKGIQLYEKERFDDSIDVFTRAISMFPNHIGLRLNIVQVALMKAKKVGGNEVEDICQRNLQAIESIEKDHPQYERYDYLCKQTSKRFG